MRIRVAALNCLGASHTEPGGSKYREYAPAAARTKLLVRVLVLRRGITVGLLQEFQKYQRTRFNLLAGSTWGIHAAGDNAVIWRKRTWRQVGTAYVTVPYFGGERKSMPAVLLEHRRTKHRVWFLSVHNPSNRRGDAAQWRHQGWMTEGWWVRNQVTAGYDVITGGDRNAKRKHYQPFVDESGRRIVADDPVWGIDYIEATSGVTSLWSKAHRSRRIRRTTDHPLVVAGLEL